MKKSILRKLICECRNKIETHPEKDNYIHWSFLIIDNIIVSSGINISCEPPVYYGYHQHVDKTFIPKIHSELSAILKLKKKIKNFTCINIRLNKSGETRLSMPCKKCIKILKKFHCKNVFFTMEKNKWEKLNF